MEDKPGYKCFLSHFYTAGGYRVIASKKGDDVTYFKDTTKKYIKVLSVVVSAFIFVSTSFLLSYFHIILLSMLFSRLIIVLPIFLVPFFLTLWYPFFSFEIITREEAFLYRQSCEKKSSHFGNRGLSLYRFFVPALVIVLCLTASYFASPYTFFRINVDNASVTKPVATATVEFFPESAYLDNQYRTVKGYFSNIESKHKVKVYVFDTSDSVSVLLNRTDINQYKYMTNRSSTSYGSYYYDIPAVLFKPVNTLSVQSGQAQLDWTIVLTDMYGKPIEKE